jgi:hypothetical protein
MTPNPETRLVMLPKVVTGQLIEKFDNFSLYNQAAGFETGSTSNSNSMTTWIEPRELAPELSCRPVLPHEHFPYNLRSASAVDVAALITCRAGKEIVSKYSDSNVVPDYNSDSSYEFDFGLDLIVPKSEHYSTEEPLLGTAASLVITSTPAARFINWPDQKPANLTYDNSHCIAYLETHPFQEGTP